MTQHLWPSYFIFEVILSWNHALKQHEFFSCQKNESFNLHEKENVQRPPAPPSPGAFRPRIILLLLNFWTKWWVWELLKSYVPMQAWKKNPFEKIQKCLLSLNRLLTSAGFFFFLLFSLRSLSWRNWIQTDPSVTASRQNRCIDFEQESAAIKCPLCSHEWVEAWKSDMVPSSKTATC